MPTAASATVFSQTSAISSLGSLTISTDADRLAVDDHRHVAALDRRRDQRREPGRRGGAIVAA